MLDDDGDSELLRPEAGLGLRAKLQAFYRFLSGRRTAYQRVFGSVYAEEVLKDLARFCRANETTVHENERMSAVLEGRREVWLRIQEHLHLSPDEIFELYTGERVDSLHTTER